MEQGALSKLWRYLLDQAHMLVKGICCSVTQCHPKESARLSGIKFCPPSRRRCVAARRRVPQRRGDQR